MLSVVTIPSSLISIGEYAFSGCANLVSAFVYADSANLTDYVFNNCPILADVVIATNTSYVTEDDGYAPKDEHNVFHDCPSISCVLVSKHENGGGVPSFSIMFGDEYISSITDVKLIDGITHFGYKSLANMSNLTGVLLGAQLSSLGKETFSNCTSLSTITIPEGVTTIGESVFEECTNLENFTIPSHIAIL